MGRIPRQGWSLNTIREIDGELIAAYRTQSCGSTLRQSPRLTAVARESIGDWRSTASSSASALGASGTNCTKRFGDDSSVHRWFQRCGAAQRRLPERIWAILLEECEEFGAVDWLLAKPQTVELGKARFGGEEKVGEKIPRTAHEERHQTVRSWSSRDGGPLGVVIAGANVVWIRSCSTQRSRRSLSNAADPGTCRQRPCCSRQRRYDQSLSGHEVTARHGYIPHIRPIGRKIVERKARAGRRKPRRLGGGATLAWLSKCRAALDPLRQA